MKTRQLKKLFVYVCAMVLMMCIGIAGTIAYFTDSESVVNTFTVGHVAITLDEANVDGKDADGADNSTVERDTANKYHLLPGSEYDKDPTIHVASDSEDCILFVKVENGIAAIETSDETKTIAAQMDDLNWKLVPGETNIYCLMNTDGVTPLVVVGGANKVVFNTFTIDGDKVVNVPDGETVPADKYDLSNYLNSNITVTAYAIQASGFEAKTVAEIWAATGF